MYPFTQKYYKIYQIKTWSCRYSHSLHFLLRPIFPSCLAFACPRVAAWLTDWLAGRKFKFLDSIRKPAGVLVASPRGQLVLRPILRKNTTAATQPLGYVKVVTFKTFWKGEFHPNLWIAFLPLVVETFGGGEGEEESEAGCHLWRGNVPILGIRILAARYPDAPIDGTVQKKSWWLLYMICVVHIMYPEIVVPDTNLYAFICNR